eukprot:CAMPEP_0179077008 /NCGR_PEP_ID=MMETSP0796-20121207/34395_1 /TAXON_ID=73915 /ORGANISM="Pyrodinium bahamense, Strain pbaha01" /LENGTH=42 /DNA_ID= /DNA_START= /DNA_END= /DNA_ORIENTATION=
MPRSFFDGLADLNEEIENTDIVVRDGQAQATALRVAGIIIAA